MTKEEAIERLKSDIYKYADFTENPNENEFWTAFDMAIKALEQRWIPVSERLPEAKGCKEYLVTVAHFKPEYKGRFVEVCEYDAREFWDGRIPTWERQEDDGGRVVAWMPLPEPYKAESEEG